MRSPGVALLDLPREVLERMAAHLATCRELRKVIFPRDGSAWGGHSITQTSFHTGFVWGGATARLCWADKKPRICVSPGSTASLCFDSGFVNDLVVRGTSAEVPPDLRGAFEELQSLGDVPPFGD